MAAASGQVAAHAESSPFHSMPLILETWAHPTPTGEANGNNQPLRKGSEPSFGGVGLMTAAAVVDFKGGWTDDEWICRSSRRDPRWFWAAAGWAVPCCRYPPHVGDPAGWSPIGARYHPTPQLPCRVCGVASGVDGSDRGSEGERRGRDG